MKTCTLLLLAAGALLLLHGCHAITGDEDYYELLGLQRDATSAQIRKNYRKLAKDYHPDRNKDDPDAQKKFQAIAQAYEVLSDDEKRQIYDTHGKEGLEKNQHGGGGGFGSVFDNFFNFGGRREQQQKKGPTINIDLSVTLKDLYQGAQIEFEVSKQVVCQQCRGTGAKNPNDVKKCKDCNGKGMKIVTHQVAPGFVQQMQQQCGKCGGKGKISTSKCAVCGGQKVTHGTDDLLITIDRGMPDTQEIVFSRAGDQLSDIEIVPGDVVFTLRTLPHPKFARRGNDLHMTMAISLLEALTGFKKTFKHLDGHAVDVTRDKVTQPGYVMQIKDEGMPHHHAPTEFGDLFIEFTVVLPQTVTADDAARFKELLA